MRYSVLIYLTRMADTLLEAIEYLKGSETPELREELLENGRQMLSRMKDVLVSHADDLKNHLPLERLNKLEFTWVSAEEKPEVETLLREWKGKLSEEVHYQVRAVFFAELGEKWDAMESVYAYMRDDPRFDPVVVLTPVFRIVKQADGTTKQDVIYKDYLTQLGIPFLGYDDYDIEKDCPELAFTSQPYESCTLPQFWAENIAKYTRLVYLPYFLPNYITKMHIESLCRLPIYNYAWFVPGNNEKHQAYYKKHSRHNGANMLLTGLPKADPMVMLKDRKIKLPTKWKKLSGKKVFLWNSWYDATASSQCYFDTIIEYFRTHEDCALIWRPHPMTDTVTKLYHPEKYNQYLERIKKVDSMPNAVMDREVSCEAAFYYSDAQISDFSSLMSQYLFLDKPLLWVKNHRFEMTGEELIDSVWMEKTWDAQGIVDFLERTRRGEDRNSQLREQVKQYDLAWSDGKCGERLCNLLFRKLHEEDSII